LEKIQPVYSRAIHARRFLLIRSEIARVVGIVVPRRCSRRL